jgi:hypothetical protein
MSEVENCTQESVGKARKKVAGSPKNARKKVIAGRSKSTRKVKGNGKT